MRILVTGGAGFIGSALCRHLVANSHHDVLNIDALTYAGNLASLTGIERHPRYRFVRQDIADTAAMVALFTEFRPDTVMHLAAESHVDRSINSASPFLHSNVMGTFSMLEAAHSYWKALDAEARQAFRFLHVSTDEVYGTLGEHGSFTEETAYDPRSPYSATKAASDHLASAWYHTYGLPVLISACSNNYGPFQYPEKLIPLTILNCLHNQPLPVYGEGRNIRDWLHVEDHVRALERIVLAGVPGRKYNIGASAERRNLDMVEAVCNCLDLLCPRAGRHRDLITFVRDRPGHDYRYAIDARRLKEELGWAPQISLETGLRDTVAWYLENRWWWEPLRQRGTAGAT